MDTSNLVFTGIVVQEGDEYVVYCTELDVVSQGESVKEAKEMLQEAIGLYLNSCIESNLPYILPIPQNEDPRNETPADVVEVYRIKVDVGFRVYA